MTVQEARDACHGGPIQLIVLNLYTCILLGDDRMLYVRHEIGKTCLLDYDLQKVYRDSSNWEPIREFAKP